MKNLSVYQRPVAVFLVTMSLMIVALAVVPDIPIKLYPNTSKTRINVNIPHPSYNAEDFDREFSETIQSALRMVDGVESIETNFNNGSTSSVVHFGWGSSGTEAKAAVAAAMAGIRSDLPEESERYRVNYWAGRTAGFYAIAAYSDKIDSKEIFSILEPLVKPELARLKNVDVARINPVEETHVDLHLMPTRLAELNLTPDDIANSVRRGYKNASLGSFRGEKKSYSVRIRQGIENLEDIKDIVVKIEGQRTIRLRDIANVKIYNGLPSQLYSVNGQMAVTVFAMPDQNGNIRDLSMSINDILNGLKGKIPDHIKFQSLVDPGSYIDNAIANVLNAGLIGGLLAIFITFIFLGETRNTVLIAVSIPLSVILSFILMKYFGVTINLISLGGLSLAVGMVVDASIVIIENIYRHVSEGKSGSVVAAIIAATKEVRSSIIASTLTSIVVFLPITFTSELTAAVLGDLARTVIFVLCTSLAVALVVIPTLAVFVFKRSESASDSVFKKFSMRQQERIVSVYARILGFLLGSKFRAAGTVMTPIAILTVAVFTLAPKITREIMAKPDSARVSLRFTHFESTEKEQLMEAIEPVEERILSQYKDVLVNLFARIHRANSGSFTLTLTSSEIRDQVIARLQEDFQTDQNWRFEISRWDPSELPLPRTDDLRIAFTGPDSRKIIALMEKAVEEIRSLDLYADVSTEPTTESTNFLVLNPRKSVVDQIPGVTLDKLGSAGRIMISGTRVIETVHRDEIMDISLGFEEDSIAEPDDIGNMQYASALGSIPFRHFFDFEFSKGVSEIMRIDTDRVFYLTAKLKASTPRWQRELLEQKVQAQLIGFKVPDGYSFRFEDTQSDINSATASLLVALLTSVMLIYVVLGIQFNSLIGPLVIIFSVPLGLIGVICSLYFADSTVSLNSMLGTILLGGIVVNNSILIFDFYQQFRAEFSNKVEALMHACKLRLIPIMITTITTILGMLPIAMAMGEGTNVIQPLGIAVAGGLGISTLCTIFVIPSLLFLLPDIAKKKAQEAGV